MHGLGSYMHAPCGHYRSVQGDGEGEDRDDEKTKDGGWVGDLAPSSPDSTGRLST